MNFNWNEKLFRVKGSILRRFWRFFKLRPSSFPYLSGDTLRATADMIYEEGTNTVRPEQVGPNTVIFVESPRVEEFFHAILPTISHPFTLITHNGDTIIDDRLADLGLSGGKITKWYAMSAMTRQPKIVPLPAGLENRRFYFNGVPALFDRLRHHLPREQKVRILYGFSISTNPAEREPALVALSHCLLADPLSGWPSAPRYLELLAGYKFVAAPAGAAMDSHRMWEALYLGVTPIIRHSVLMDSFRELGLPIWLIDDWCELDGLTEADLSRRYTELWGNAKTESLWAGYWLKRLRNQD